MTHVTTLVVALLVAVSLAAVPGTVAAPAAEPTIEEACDDPPVRNGSDAERVGAGVERVRTDVDQVNRRPPDVNVYVSPERSRVDAGETATFTVCVVNRSPHTFYNLTRIWHSGDGPEMMYLIGPNHCFENENRVGTRPIGPSPTEACDGKPEREDGEEGMAVYSVEDGLQPGDVVHYTVVANVSRTGTYEIRAEYGRYDLNALDLRAVDSDSSELTVYCSPSCLFQRHQDLILSLVGIAIGLVSLGFASSTVRNRLRGAASGARRAICGNE